MAEPETIVAVATPQGRGGIGVVRISGAAAVETAKQLVKTRVSVEPNVARYGQLVDETMDVVDHVVVVWFRGPRSYTGEDVVEISAHGSPVVLEWIVRRAVELGARPARPGEFTERAFLNRRIDLTQAEAVRDLIDAQTMEQARVAAEQVGGSLAAKVRPAKEELVRLIAELEAGIDFAEDDIDTLSTEAIAPRLQKVREPMEKLLATFAYGRVLHAGVKLAIVGAPNAGKSSLFNRLVERDRAIVTPIAGTTRDVVSERVSIGGVPVELMDTAGLRDATDEVERIGIERSREAIADADVVLVVADASESASQQVSESALALLDGRTVLWVKNKIDLVRESASHASSEAAADGAEFVGAGEEKQVSPLRHSQEAANGSGRNDGVPDGGSAHVLEAGRGAHRSGRNDDVSLCAPREPAFSQSERKNGAHGPSYRVSALTGAGIEELRAGIVRAVTGGAVQERGGVLTNLRQRAAVERCVEGLLRAEEACVAGIPHEMILLDVYEALRGMDELTGETTADDVLGLIFSTFCIGK